MAERLQLVPGNLEEEIVERLIIYHRNIDGITEAYRKVMKSINADQPKADVFSEGRWMKIVKPSNIPLYHTLKIGFYCPGFPVRLSTYCTIPL